jgi:hypothetical protein
LDALSIQMAPDGSRPIVWMIIGMIKAHPTKNRMPRQAALDRHSICLASISPLLSRTAADLCPVLAAPAVSRVVAEDAHQPLPFQHRVDQVTVEEWDGVDAGQPWVRLDVEV